jgi:hypothetical protein
MYEEGMGVARDYVQAYLWFGLAAKKPHGYDLDSLARKMTAEQIAEAKRLVNEWEARQTIPVEADAEHASAEQSSAREPAASSCINEYFTKLEFPGPLVPLDGSRGRWELALEPSRTDEKVTFYACVPSEPVAKDHSDRETPSLFVICGIGVIDVAAIVAVDYGVQNDRPVVTRFNGAEPETATWRISPDKKALVAPVTGGKFAKKLMMHGELSVQLRLSKQKLVEFTYDLRGATDTLQVLRQACKWE